VVTAAVDYSGITGNTSKSGERGGFQDRRESCKPQQEAFEVGRLIGV
jgi:hypothetical protein